MLRLRQRAYGDGYCTACGQRRAEPDRDEAELRGVVLITDRGLEHARNEDAAAAGIVRHRRGRPHAIAAAVCDGVSTTGDAHTAAVAASKAGVEAMVAALAASRSGACGCADRAWPAPPRPPQVPGSADGSAMAPSCTYTAAVVVPTATGTVEIAVGNVGDSRVYWLPEPPAHRTTPDRRRLRCP